MVQVTALFNDLQAIQIQKIRVPESEEQGRIS
jgi:hypothetical protein